MQKGQVRSSTYSPRRCIFCVEYFGSGWFPCSNYETTATTELLWYILGHFLGYLAVNFLSVL